MRGRSADALAGPGLRDASPEPRAIPARAARASRCRSSTQRSEPSVSKAWHQLAAAGFQLRAAGAGSRCCMLGERSSSTIVVSARPPAASPSQPLASGRLTAKIRPAIATIRSSMISHCRSRA